MSSLNTTISKVPNGAYLTNNDEPTPKEETPVEKPAEEEAAS
ncbi:MAG TPA: hypothetical protein VD947_03380 [Patescibacteria group bacterium]|nr:hypothetical protein [Patescibacteria group bacterium]